MALPDLLSCLSGDNRQAGTRPPVTLTAMPDAPGRDATRRDNLHSMSVRQLEAAIAAAGVVMSHRQLLRHCKAGTFDAVKLPAANNVEEWFVAPASLEKGIADIKVLQEHRARRVASRQDMTGNDTPTIAKQTDADASGHDATGQDPSDAQIRDEKDATRHDTSRQVTTTDVDVYEHPYVKRLEAQVDKLEKKLDDQVRRTEEIQLRGQEKLLELQRMTAVGQSQRRWPTSCSRRKLGCSPAVSRKRRRRGAQLEQLSPTHGYSRRASSYNSHMSCWVSLADKATRLPAAVCRPIGS